MTTPTTLIQFAQGSTTGTAGWALFGVVTTPVTVSNGGVNPSPGTWTFTVLDVPSGSAVPVGVAQSGSTPTWTFVPDLAGGYLIELSITDSLGNVRTDIRCFGIKNSMGLFDPPFTSNSASLNFGGQSRGWAAYMDAWFAYILTLSSSVAGSVTSVTATAPIASSGGTTPNISLAYPLVSPSVTNTSTWGAPSYGSGVTYAKTLNVAPTPLQTTSGAHTNVVIMTVPLPGTTGAPCTVGQCTVVYDVDVTGPLTSGGYATGAKWMGTIGYSVETSGSPVLCVSLQPVASGTASSGTAPPSGWTLVAQLDGGSLNIELVLTTDSLGTYSVNAIGQAKYTQ